MDYGTKAFFVINRYASVKSIINRLTDVMKNFGYFLDEKGSIVCLIADKNNTNVQSRDQSGFLLLDELTQEDFDNSSTFDVKFFRKKQSKFAFTDAAYKCDVILKEVYHNDCIELTSNEVMIKLILDVDLSPDNFEGGVYYHKEYDFNEILLTYDLLKSVFKKLEARYMTAGTFEVLYDGTRFDYDTESGLPYYGSGTVMRLSSVPGESVLILPYENKTPYHCWDNYGYRDGFNGKTAPAWVKRV